MKIVLLVVACFLPMLATAQDVKTQPAESAKATYARIVAQIQGGQTDVDWEAMRLASVHGAVSGDFDEHDVLTKMRAALRAKNYADALKQANEAIAHNMADPEAHYVAMVAYGESGRQAESDAEKAKVVAIARSIRRNKSGVSADSAWFTVKVSEEYFMLHILGMDLEKQSLTYVNGRAYDVMTVADRDDPSHEYTYWFDTQTSMDAFSEDPKPDEKSSK
jgi:hypothetical protein